MELATLEAKARVLGMGLAKDGMKKIVEELFDDVMVLAADQAKKSIPGDIDDLVINMVLSNVQPALKAALLAQIAKI